MIHITDSMIDAAVNAADARQVLFDAFCEFAHGRASMQERIRTESAGTKVSTMAAVLPRQGYAGAKVYTTIAGRFSFVIVLFSATDGRPLASVEANAITRLRTAACSVLASRRLARTDIRRIAIFGAGVQGRAHAVQLANEWHPGEIRLSDPFATSDVARALESECATRVRMAASAEEAIDGADIIVTASRSTQPLFAGADVPRGCFIAAIGSSLPHTRELDDATLRRASAIVVDWGPQTRREAGDLVLAAPDCQIDGKLVELADLLAGRAPGRGDDEAITVYKAVGVALQDIALAGLAYERLA